MTRELLQQALGALQTASGALGHPDNIAIMESAIAVLQAALAEQPATPLPAMFTDEAAQKLLHDTIDDMQLGKDFLEQQGEVSPKVWQYGTGPVGMAISRTSLAARGAEQPAAPVPSILEKDELEQIIDDYVDDYELIGENESGADACHTPTEFEQMLIKDAIMGLLAYPEWDEAWGRHIQSLAPAAPVLTDAEIIPIGRRLGVTAVDTLAFQSGFNGTDNLSDWCAFWQAMIAARPGEHK